MKNILFLCFLFLFDHINNVAIASEPFSPKRSGVSDSSLLGAGSSAVAIFASQGEKGGTYHKRLPFFQRMIVSKKVSRILREKQSGKTTEEEADKVAVESVIVGIIALAFSIIPWYTLALAIPFGILAVGMGLRARKMGSKKPTGKAMGILALVAVAVWIGVIALTLAFW